MLFLKSWLADYINLEDYTDQQISDLLSLNSGECEEINLITDYFGGKVVVGVIQNLYKHPDADKLNIFDVYLGEEFKAKYGHDKVQIVSAAPNARNGLICPVALDGAKLPYITIAAKKMRGLESQGMCCGMSELALEMQYSAGLWELNGLVGEDKIGQSICDVLPNYFPAQTTFEIKYLQDRLSTCANHLGLAIEIAICLQKPELLRGLAKQVYHKEDFYTESFNKIQASDIQITLKDDTKTIDVYNIFDLQLPEVYNLDHVFQTRMFLTGKNLIGGLADLSNYFLFDFGQPNHFFSSSKIDNYNWKFDKLESEQKFQGLGQFKNGVLPKGLTVMQDAKDSILIVPGITGSAATKTEEAETRVLLEITNFDKEMVARNSFAMNYRSDSAKVFASGISKYLQLIFLTKLTTTLPQAKVSHSLLWNNGEVSDSINDLYKSAFALDLEENTTLIIDLEYIADRLDDRGLEYWQPIILQKLSLLGQISKMSKQDLAAKYEKDSGGFVLEEGDILDVEFYTLLLNPYYSKVESMEDVLFEVTKLVGLENLKPEYLTFSTESKTPDYHSTLNNFRSILTKFGYSEILTRPFLPQNLLLSSLTKTEHVALEALSSQRADEPFLRDSLFAQNMQTISKNIKLGIKEPKVFELTRIYTHSKEVRQNQFSKQIDQGNTRETWTLSATAVSEDPYLLTSLIHEVGNKFGLKISFEQIAVAGKLPLEEEVGSGFPNEVSPRHKGLAPKETGVTLGNETNYNLTKSNRPQIIAKLTEVANSFKKTFDLPINKKVWFVDFSFDPEGLEFDQYNQYADVSDYPAITRSYSWVVPKMSQWSAIHDIINAVNLNYPEIQIQIQPTERMPKDGNCDILNYEVEFVSSSRTLKNEEIESWSGDVFAKVKGVYGEVEMR